VSILKVPRKGFLDHSAVFQFRSPLLSLICQCRFYDLAIRITALGWIQTVLKAKRAALPREHRPLWKVRAFISYRRECH